MPPIVPNAQRIEVLPAAQGVGAFVLITAAGVSLPMNLHASEALHLAGSLMAAVRATMSPVLPPTEEEADAPPRTERLLEIACSYVGGVCERMEERGNGPTH